MNNFAELSDGGSAEFLVRWRGRQEGPYPASVIEAKLTANEIGLLHEIFQNGKWVTIRDYIREREAIRRAEHQAKEEQERRVREETERQAKEREEQRRAELLAADERKNSKPQLASSQQIHERKPSFDVPGDNQGQSGFRTFGALLFIAGVILAGYFFLSFDTSVESGAGRVNNLGLMADRQNGIIVGIGLGVVGAIMLAIGSRGKN